MVENLVWILFGFIIMSLHPKFFICAHPSHRPPSEPSHLWPLSLNNLTGFLPLVTIMFILSYLVKYYQCIGIGQLERLMWPELWPELVLGAYTGRLNCAFKSMFEENPLFPILGMCMIKITCFLGSDMHSDQGLA